MEPVEIQSAKDVTPECLTAAEEVFTGYHDHDGRPVDWEAFWDRLEAYGWSITEFDSPAATKIQRHIRKYRAL